MDDSAHHQRLHRCHGADQLFDHLLGDLVGDEHLKEIGLNLGRVNSDRSKRFGTRLAWFGEA